MANSHLLIFFCFLVDRFYSTRYAEIKVHVIRENRLILVD